MLIADLSNNNGAVDFARLAKVPGLVGVLLKATEGRTFTDKTMAADRSAAHAHGLRVGVYHFARFGDVHQEAAHFLSVAPAPWRRDFRPVLDAEAGSGKGREAWIRQWCRLVWKVSGVCPMVYSYPSWLEDLAASRPLGCGLWLASYGRNDGTEHPYTVPKPWKKAVLHQFTSNARLPGVAGPCDLSAAPRLRPLLAHPLRGLV